MAALRGNTKRFTMPTVVLPPRRATRRGRRWLSGSVVVYQWECYEFVNSGPVVHMSPWAWYLTLCCSWGMANGMWMLVFLSTWQVYWITAVPVWMGECWLVYVIYITCHLLNVFIQSDLHTLNTVSNPLHQLLHLTSSNENNGTYSKEQFKHWSYK